MGKLLMLNKLVAVRTLKKIRIKQRLLAEKQKKFEKIFHETMNIAAKQRGSACSECAKQRIKNEKEIAASVLSKGSKTAGMAARRKLLKLRIKRKLVEEEKRKLEEEEDKEKRKLEEEEDKWKLEEEEDEEEDKRKLEEEEDKRKLEEEEDKRKLEEEEIEKMCKLQLEEDYNFLFYSSVWTQDQHCDG